MVEMNYPLDECIVTAPWSLNLTMAV